MIPLTEEEEDAARGTQGENYGNSDGCRGAVGDLRFRRRHGPGQ